MRTVTQIGAMLVLGCWLAALPAQAGAGGLLPNLKVINGHDYFCTANVKTADVNNPALGARSGLVQPKEVCKEAGRPVTNEETQDCYCYKVKMRNVRAHALRIVWRCTVQWVRTGDSNQCREVLY